MTSLQTIYGLHRRLLTASEEGPVTEATLENIKKCAGRGRAPEFKKNLGPFLQFAAKWAGGKDRRFLDELNRWQKCIGIVRDVEASLYKQIAELKGVEEWPVYIIAVMKASAPPTHREHPSSRLRVGGGMGGGKCRDDG